jgi:hypothetical protein
MLCLIIPPEKKVDVRTMKRILVEDDDYLRIVPAILDPAVPEERRNAIADFVRHDVPDFAGWCRDLWQKIPDLYPATIEFAFNQEDLRAKLPFADGVIVESSRIEERELALAPRLTAVIKFGTRLSNIDVAAYEEHAVPVEIHARRPICQAGARDRQLLDFLGPGTCSSLIVLR